jgi:cell division septation protein DedD
MNKAEIIRRISKIAGVPDTETKRFFEIFLKNVSDILKPGESLKIPEVGLFQLRVGKIESSTGEAGQNFIYSDLIVFIQEEEQNLIEGEEIIFNVPSGIEEDYQPIDSYFSLSIGKPVIPLKGVRTTEFFIPTSGPELISRMESKISRLLDEAEKIEGGKETETILLKSRDKSVEIEPLEQEEEVPSRSEFMKTREFENLSWDFGENLSQEIEEESVPDLDKTESPAEVTKQEEVEWMGDTEEDSGMQAEKEHHFEEEETIDDNQDDEIFEDIIEEETTPIFEEEEIIPEEVSDSESESVTEEEAEETISETETISEEESSEISIPNEDKIQSEESETEEPVLKNFQRVSSLTKEFTVSPDEEGEEETDTEEAPRRITEVRGGFQKVRRTTAEFDFDLSGIKGLDEEDEITGKEETKKAAAFSKRTYEGYHKRSTIPSLIIAFVVVIVLAGIIYMYLRIKSENHEPANANITGTAKQQTKVIDRNYDVPVTYPYDSSTENKPSNLPEDVQKPDEKVSTGKPENENVAKTKPDISEIRRPVNAERIGRYIYKYPQGIVVQVSSWKSKSIAISQVRKYNKAGYTAFAEMTTVSGQGLYYRVRVGYFNSLDEAKEFADRNQ